jgi:hypothetical protein
MLQNRKSPSGLNAQALPDIITLPGGDVSENSQPFLTYQASHLRSIVKMSWPVARLTAELAFANGGRP